MGHLWRADDERPAGGLHHDLGDDVHMVDVEDAGDLGEQPLDEAKVAAGGPDNGGDGIRVVELP